MRVVQFFQVNGSTLPMSIENIKRVMDKADETDIKVAIESWWKYKRLTAAIARKHGFADSVGAAVFAALSPNNDYFGNLRDCDRLLAAARARQPIESFKVSTYGNNKQKAWEIAHGREALDLIVFKKTRNFYLNIIDPTNPIPVTIDGHCYNIWKGERIRLTAAAQRLKPKLYDLIANDMRTIAVESRLIPNQVQAIAWITWRRIHRIRVSDQSELWDQEYLAANLGFVPASP